MITAAATNAGPTAERAAVLSNLAWISSGATRVAALAAAATNVVQGTGIFGPNTLFGEEWVGRPGSCLPGKR
jgi:hypothetical protein